MRALPPILAALVLAALALVPAGAGAQEGGGNRGFEEESEIADQDWSFDGVFGTFDRASAQRGFQIYRQICSSCHSLRLIAFRHLAGLGYEEGEIAAIAAEYTVVDGPNGEGEMFERPATAADYIPPPFPNEPAARAANNGAFPPDLSLIIDARENGANYVYAFLTGFEDPPEEVELMPGMYYNRAYPGHQTAMPPMLVGDDVTYADGTPATLQQESRDVVTFLAWASEPNMEVRKQMGVRVVLFLVVFTALVYAVKRKVWADVEH